MALYIPHSIFHLVRLLYVRPETFGTYYVIPTCCSPLPGYYKGTSLKQLKQLKTFQRYSDAYQT